MALTDPIGRLQQGALAVLAVGMTVTVGTALGFQHLAGYIPCKLCLEQRTPYYIGAPVMIAGLIAAFAKAPPILVRGILLAGALLMTWSLYLGVFHAGVEWGWWLGPSDCGVVAPAPSGGSLLDSLNSVIPPSCDQAAGRFLGLSFAGWNAVASFVLAAIGYVAAFRKA
ncbi:disulfide bond formation protein B [Aliihoeflea sp. 40Bstr573]|uniref:disulfide bond formation protein B n=1 Tax=Aliihoeflea sp. 40Bstr573 TaxID=2696467 RepID=UPI002095C9B2|nr:disulfide bond formation protein B [Aliihoeflea sp. 40Bstr573]MCO6387183.1 disulfide bond formation protein B [Aliihoeflea sp. 40Bstr573]